jgi:hypothetical protein
VSGFIVSPFVGRMSGTSECACRHEESKIGRCPAANNERVPRHCLSHDRKRISRTEQLYDIATHPHGFGRCSV